ncbi:hypothetical protein Nepgr_017692 [Nepenthes gracilis]|uniref:Glutaredoxin domain-containing protein n=1 Tax=Nepenthes gracilis TaxID=150966 RepID=A0AAD3SSI0_NEPGR|nr:hypothetical protein Nepgr_017692 [Nepenthes gracilis]
MHESGELKEVFRGHGIKSTDSIDEKEAKAGSGKPSVSTGLSSSLSSRLETLVNSSPVMLFMKGKPVVSAGNYPQLYIQGKLIGGSHVALEMQKSGELKRVLAEKGMTNSKVVNALKEEGVSFKSFDILSDEEVRLELKTFSNWLAYPQLYYKGELIGGCDIIMDLQSNRELKSTLSD